MPCTFFHFILKCCLLAFGLIGLCFTFCGSKGRIHTRMSFLLLLLLFLITQDLFLIAKILSKNSKLKTLLDVCLWLQVVLGSLQAGRSTRYPSIYWNPWSVKELIINISNYRVQEKINADYKINLLLSLPPVSGSTLLPITLSISTVSGASRSTKIIISNNYRLKQNCF